MRHGLRLYLAGPMRGIPQYNFPEFDRVTKLLRDSGHRVFNPAEFDREVLGIKEFPNDTDWSQFPVGMEPTETMLADLRMLSKCDGVALLDGWGKSRGAQCETYFANFVGIGVAGWRAFVDVMQEIK